MSESRKSQHISEVLTITSYRQEMIEFNALLTDVITLFRTRVHRAGGHFSLIEIARQYLGVMSSMVWRLSVLTFEVGNTQAPELQVFKQNIVTLLNNITKVEVKIRDLVRAEKLWTQYYKGSVQIDKKDRPIPTKFELYWTTVVKNALDKIYHDTGNLIHTAISLGAIYKVRLSIMDDMRNQPVPYQPKYSSITEADESRQKSIKQAIGRSELE